jgi:hypothetical protein
MRSDEVKTMADALRELSEDYAYLTQTAKGTTGQAKATKKLWRTGNKSWLIKAGLALIALPDPTVSDVVGSAMVAAGVVQEGIKRRTLYVDDAYKTFQKTMKEIRNVKDTL